MIEILEYSDRFQGSRSQLLRSMGFVHAGLSNLDCFSNQRNRDKCCLLIGHHILLHTRQSVTLLDLAPVAPCSHGSSCLNVRQRHPLDKFLSSVYMYNTGEIMSFHGWRYPIVEKLGPRACFSKNFSDPKSQLSNCNPLVLKSRF